LIISVAIYFFSTAQAMEESSFVKGTTSKEQITLFLTKIGAIDIIKLPAPKHKQLGSKTTKTFKVTPIFPGDTKILTKNSDSYILVPEIKMELL
jgi:hypothetical protein